MTITHPDPSILWIQEPGPEIKLEPADNPLPQGTLGDIQLATKVSGPESFPPAILIQPFAQNGLAGLVGTSIRVFRWDVTSRSLRPVWNSGINLGLGFIWAKIRRPGIYVPLGLPLDRLLHEALRSMAQQRPYSDPEKPEEMEAITRSALTAFIEAPEALLEEARRLLTTIEAQTSLEPASQRDLRRKRGGYLLPFPLPQDDSLAKFKQRIARLQTPPGGLPEEALFYPPEAIRAREGLGTLPRLHSSVSAHPIDRRALSQLSFLKATAQPHAPQLSAHPLETTSPDWWMYHHDVHHTGWASGNRAITSTTVGSMQLRSTIPVSGSVVTVPSIVQGSIYIGTSDFDAPGAGRILYKIDLASGKVLQTFSTPLGPVTNTYAQGIGGSPAIVDGSVYFSTVAGKIYCVDATTLEQRWVTDIRSADPAHKQPVQNDKANCWSSPLVVNGRVYVGCGEGEFGAFGFIYCLDARTGDVVWLFCTNKFSTTQENRPNAIPGSAVGVTPLPGGFTQQTDPAERGASVWSSCAYSEVLNRIYVGTGNSTAGDSNPLPDAYYGSGVIALDAETGEFRAFFQPSPSDCYRPSDTDVDMSSSPLLFTCDGREVLAIGSKGGSFFLLDATTLAPIARRQLLPYDGNGNPLPNVDLYTGSDSENGYGIFGTAGLQPELGRLYVGIGGDGGAIDAPTTPFMRALDWRTLKDVWATGVGADGITRYTVPRPPLYAKDREAGLSSPAVVNDVVFVSTTKPGLYAFDAMTGLCLWSAEGLPLGYPLGPAIYDKYVVIGSGSSLNIYSL